MSKLYIFLLSLVLFIHPASAQPVNSPLFEVPKDNSITENMIHSAEQGNKTAQYTLATLYFNGGTRLFPLDYDKARYWYLKAAEQGHTSAQLILALIYELGFDLEPDKEQALHWYQEVRKSDPSIIDAENSIKKIQQADYNVSQKQYVVGMTFLAWADENSQRESSFLQISKDLLVRSASQGNSDAQYYLVLLWETGNKLNLAASDVARWASQVTGDGKAYAKKVLSGLYLAGNGVEKDEKKSFELLQQATQLDSSYVPALAKYYYNGIGTPKNVNYALELLEQRSENSEALFTLGAFYHSDPKLKNEQKSFEYMEQAADKGHPIAMLSIGLFYSEGLVVSRSTAEAINWFNKAQEKAKEMNAISALTKFVEDSVEGVATRSNAKADEYFSNGFLYRTASFVKQDFTKARFFFEKAAKEHYAPALFHLAEMYELGEGVEIDQKKAFELYQQAAIHGDTEAQVKVADFYRNGFATNKNINKAKEWYQKAALGKGEFAEQAKLILKNMD
ncbi:TPR repeat protein [Cricetibacter osteomyelitidis]|uniref:TPR repeat protein n=1 Tax=Cricetibacter osteomyelitidis TaxID=1521931 RepID=A0A4R2TJH4_9PAST|nr:tetratricopeptide repeat protein [Cricetibacter osteomyelitidis]TCP94962.1 TPR repeat protein [Cricetibacter osteomyelitidis]